MNQENKPHHLKRPLVDKSNVKGELLPGKKRAHAVMFLDAKKTKKNRIIAEENQENVENQENAKSDEKIIKIEKIEKIAVVEKIETVVIEKAIPDNQENVAPVNPFKKADFDVEDDDDPLMCSEYIFSILSYLRQQEQCSLPSSFSNTVISMKQRGQIMNELIETHHIFRLLPETIFLASNIFDRVITTLKVSSDQSCSVMLVSLMIAAKFEEIFPPSVKHLLRRATDLGITDLNHQRVYDIEHEILKAIKYDLSYPNPFNFLRRVSKVDDYNSETRTVAKYFMEISIVDQRLAHFTPSRLSASAFWCATKVLKGNEWVLHVYLG